MSGRGTNRGGKTLSSRGRHSTGRGRIVVQVTPTIPSPQVSLNQSLSHAQLTPSPHINTMPSPSPTQTPTPTPTPSATIPQNPLRANLIGFCLHGDMHLLTRSCYRLLNLR